MRKLIIGVVVFTTLLFSSCSPSKMIERAVKKDPSLAMVKTETVYIPEVTVDTFFSTTIDTVELASTIDSIFLTIPDCTGCYKATEKIVKVFSDRKLIQDTIYTSNRIINDSLDLGVTIQIWQDGTKVHVKAILEEAAIKVKQVSVVQKESKGKAMQYFLAGLAGMILSFLLITRIKR